MSDTVEPVKQIAYDKPALSLPDQVAHLKTLGLLIADESDAAHRLDFIGLSRLSGYFPPLQEPGIERFRPGTTFDQVMELYTYDRRVRVLFFDALERIEVGVKASLSNHMSAQGGPFWFLDPRFLADGQDEKVQVSLREAVGFPQNPKDHPVIRDHFQRYKAPDFPPSWKAMEALSFGGVSFLFRNLAGREKAPIADLFHLPSTVFASWLHALAHYRNVCAHHGRMWNRQFTIRPKLPRKTGWDPVIGNESRLFTATLLTDHMMRVIDPTNGWAGRVADLVDTCPMDAMGSMGFPRGWTRHLGAAMR